MSATKEGTSHRMKQPLSRAHAELIAEMRRLREGKRISGRQLADTLGWSQSKLSKIERGETRPAVEDVEAWLEKVNAPTGRTRELVTLAAEVANEPRAWSAVAAANSEIRTIEAQTTHLKNFQPAAISGLLQTADYARRVMSMIDGISPTEITAAVGVRVDRQTVLYDQAKKFEFVLTEAALRWRPGPPSLMLAQLDRLISVATLPNVTIGVLPFEHEAKLLYTNGFTIFEGIRHPFVLVEALSDERRLDDIQSLRKYREAFTRARAAATVGTEAAAFIRRVMADLGS